MAHFCLILIAAWLLSACAAKGGEGARWVPADAEASFVVADLDGLRESLAVFMAGIEGASGTIALIEARTGLDLGSRAGLVEGGVAPDRSAAVFVHQGALGLALGVSDRTRFEQRVERQVLRMGAQVLRDPGGTALSGSAEGRDGDVPWSLAWGVNDDDVGIVIWAPEHEDASARWSALLSAGGDGGALLESAKAVLGERTGAHIRFSASPVPPASWGLGPAKMMLLPIISGLTRWEGAWFVEATRSSLTLDAPWNAEGSLAAGWFKPQGEAILLSQSIPKAQTLTLRARLNPRKVLAIPAFLRKRFLPKRVPGPLAMVVPPIEDLLTLLNGDMSVTLLGLDAKASVDDALGPLNLAQLLQHLHVGVVLGVTDAQAAGRAVSAARHHLKEAGWFPVSL